MLTKLYPMDYKQSIFDINFEALWIKGIRGILFDIDNTLVAYDIIHPTEEIIQLFEQLKARGFQICLVSNNTKDRVMKFNTHLKIFAIHKAKKPRRSNLQRAMTLMHLQKHEVAMVGDQIFTDVLAGNRLGIMTILVAPVSDKDEWITKIKRGIEKKVVNQYEKTRKKAAH